MQLLLLDEPKYDNEMFKGATAEQVTSINEVIRTQCFLATDSNQK